MITRVATKLAILSIAVLVAISGGIFTFSRAAGPTQLTPQHRSPHSYGVFWQVGRGYDSTLIVRNKDEQQSVTADVVLYSNSGDETRKTSLSIPASSVARLNLRDLIHPKGDSLHYGGLMLEFNGPKPPIVMGQVVIENYDQGIIFDLPLQAGYSTDAEKTLYAPWWLSDDGTDGTVTLFNSSGQNILVTPSITVNGVEQTIRRVDLAPHETKELYLRELLGQIHADQATIGSLSLHYIGPLHSLQPAILLANSKTGFSLVSDFNAKHAKESDQQIRWRSPDVFVSPDAKLGFDKNNKLTAYALLSNGTKSTTSPELVAFVGGSKNGEVRKISLPIADLQPFETRLVNLSKFVRSGLIPTTTSYFALDVTYKGKLGDLGITVFSVGQEKDFVFKSESGINASQHIYSSYWDIDDELVALLTVQNVNDEAVDVKTTLNYQTNAGVSKYVLPSIKVSGNGVRVLNLKQIIQSGTPDENGNVIPAGITFGTLTMNVIGGGDSDVIFGGTTSFDPDKGGYGLLLDPCGQCQADDGPFCTPDGGSEDPFYGPGGGPGCTPQCILDFGCGGGGGDGGDGGGGGNTQIPTYITAVMEPIVQHNGNAIVSQTGQVMAPIAYGISRNITYTVRDQNGLPMNMSGMTATEMVFYVSSNPPKDPSQANVFRTVNISNQGVFYDVLAFYFDTPPAPISGQYAKYQQILQVNVSTPLVLSGYTLRTNCANFQYNSLDITEVTYDIGATCQ